MRNGWIYIPVLFILVLPVSCAESGLTGISRGLEGEESPENRDQGDDRPSEDGEGVPGYLTSPELIAILEKEDGLHVEAPAGTVTEPGEVRLEIFAPEKGAEVKDGELSVTSFGSVDPNDDGSVIGKVATKAPVVILGLLPREGESPSKVDVPKKAPKEVSWVIDRIDDDKPPAALTAAEFESVMEGGDPEDPKDPEDPEDPKDPEKDPKDPDEENPPPPPEPEDPLPHCGPGEGSQLASWLDSHAEGNDVADDISDALEEGAVVLDCRLDEADPGLIVVELDKGGEKKIHKFPKTALDQQDGD